MAVPSSGILTMLGLAQERKWNTYGSGPPIAHPILMTDLINGGGLNSFPALNTLSPYKPNTSTPTNSNCMNSAPAGSYSDNNVWAVWSGSAWTITGFCQM